MQTYIAYYKYLYKRYICYVLLMLLLSRIRNTSISSNIYKKSIFTLIITCLLFFTIFTVILYIYSLILNIEFWQILIYIKILGIFCLTCFNILFLFYSFFRLKHSFYIIFVFLLFIVELFWYAFAFYVPVDNINDTYLYIIIITCMISLSLFVYFKALYINKDNRQNSKKILNYDKIKKYKKLILRPLLLFLTFDYNKSITLKEFIYYVFLFLFFIIPVSSFFFTCIFIIIRYIRFIYRYVFMVSLPQYELMSITVIFWYIFIMIVIFLSTTYYNMVLFLQIKLIIYKKILIVLGLFNMPIYILSIMKADMVFGVYIFTILLFILLSTVILSYFKNNKLNKTL